MARLLWRMPAWFHGLLYGLTGCRPVMILDDETLERATAAREAGAINWREYERKAKGFSLRRFP